MREQIAIERQRKPTEDAHRLRKTQRAKKQPPAEAEQQQRHRGISFSKKHRATVAAQREAHIEVGFGEVGHRRWDFAAQPVLILPKTPAGFFIEGMGLNTRKRGVVGEKHLTALKTAAKEKAQHQRQAPQR